MGFYDKHNNAAGKQPDYGAIFMSNSATKRECFKKGLFGLPSSAIEFVEQIKAGMILFLFEYEKRQLHGVFKACSDGGMNIVPNAFSSLMTQYPAQVKFIPIWQCKPLSQSVFKHAIIENYFSANKFNFGLSEKQVRELLHLFSVRRLDPEVPERPLSRTKESKSESYPMGKSGRSVDHGMHIECVKDEQGVDSGMSPVMQRKFQGDSLQYYGEAGFGFNASEGAVNKQGRHAEFSVDTPSGYAGNYMALHDDFGYAMHEKEQFMDIHCGPTLSSGYSRSLSDKIRFQGDGMLSTTSRLSEELRKTGQSMAFSDDNLGLHHSGVNPTDFYGKPELDHNSLVQNQLRLTSGMIQPIQQQISNSRATRGGAFSKSTLLYDPDYTRRPTHLEHNSLAQNQFRPTSAEIQPVDSCATHGDVGSKSTFLYDPEYPGFNFSQSSSMRINNGLNSILESALPNNCGMSSLSNQTCLMPTELNDMNRCHDGYDFLDHGLYGRDRDCLPFNVARKAGQVAAESLAYDTHSGIPLLKSSSSLVPPSDIGISDRVDKIFSSFQNHKSYVADDVHPMSSRANLDHEMTLEKDNESFIPDVPWASEGYFQAHYDDSLVNEYDTECYDDSQNRSFGYPKKKSSVFSRLTVMQDINKVEKRNKASNEGYGADTSEVDQLMEMVHQSHYQWNPKRKPRPLVNHSKTESLKDKTPIISSRIKSDCCLKDKTPIISSKMKRDCSMKDKTQMVSPKTKRDCSERSTNDVSMDLTAASGGNANKTLVVDFKRRSQVRKFNDDSEIKSSNESAKGENAVLEVPKRRKLIRPNFSKNSTSDDRGIDLSMPQNARPFSHESYNLNNVSENGCDLVKMEDNLKTDAEGQNCNGSEDASSHAKAFVSGEGVRANDGTAQSGCLENTKNLTADSASCKGQNCHIQKGLPMMDSIESCAEWQKCINQPHSEDRSSHAKGFVRGGGVRARDGTAAASDGSECLKNIKNLNGSNMEEEMSEDGGSSFTIEDKNRSECIKNSGHEKAPSETSSHVTEASQVMDSLKPVSSYEAAQDSVCLDHHVDKTLCAGRGTDTDSEISKDGDPSLIIEAKDGSCSSQHAGNENGPIATSFHSEEGLCMTESVHSVSLDAVHSTC